MEIAIVHLSAEVLITQIISKTIDTITIINPTFAILDPQGGGVMLIEPVWSVGSTSNEFTLNKSNIIQILPARKELEEAYVNATSRIAMPPQGSGGIIIP